MLLILLLIGSAAPQDPGSLPEVRVGSVVRGLVASDSPVVETEWLQSFDLATRGARFALRVAVGGPHTIEARSDHFNTYLVLRDAAGEVIAEDDDGRVWFHPRIAAVLDAGATYLIDVGAQDARHGPFELAVRAEPLPRPKERYWEEDDAVEGERWLAAFEAREGIDTPAFAFASNDLGQRQWRRGNYVRARDLFELSIASREQLFAPDDPRLAQPLNNLALAHKRLGDLDAARRMLERSLAIKEARPEEERDLRSIATGLHNLGGVLLGQGDYAGAGRLLERALALREELLGEAPLTATTAASLSIVADKLGDEERALELAHRALAIHRRALREDHPQVAVSLNNLAELERHRGDYDAAVGHHMEALDVFEKAYGPEHPDTATSLNNIGTMLRVAAHLDAALPYLQRAHDAARAALGPEHAGAMRAGTNLAMLHGDRREYDAAWQLVQAAQAGNLARARRVLAASSESEGYAFLAMVRWQLEYLLALSPLLADEAAETGAYEAVLAWKGQLSRLMLASRASLRARLTAEQRALLDDLRACQTELARLARLPDAADGQRAERLGEERNRLEVALQRTLDALAPEDGADFDAVRASLPERSALIDFLILRAYAFPTYTEDALATPGDWGEAHVYAWVVRPDSPFPTRIDLGLADEMEDAVHTFLQTLAPHRGSPLQDGGQRDGWLALGARLFDPLAPYLEDVERVFVSPDGFLGKLPFETLPLGTDRYLIERLAFVYLQDATSLGRETARGPLDSVLAMGAVDFNRAGDDGEARETGAFRGHSGEFWPRIPATAYESQLVHDLHEAAFDGGRRRLLTGELPSEQRLKRELPGYAVLHLATHGFFQPESRPSLLEEALAERGSSPRVGTPAPSLSGLAPGLLSGLVCAGANRPADLALDDGYLTAEEVAWMDLGGVELVVLSACETGLGVKRSGEGMIGLRRAFRTAGARTVISSLWSVRDEKTAALMGDFYRYLWLDGAGVHEALRKAQLKMLEENRRENRGDGAPSTWGAFVLSGQFR